MSRYRSLSDSLWGAFANPDFNPPQAPEQIWAMREGLRRIDPWRIDWREVKANKDHACTRGCAIKRNEVYYQLQSGGGWGSELKVCAGCLAMILFFKQVAVLPLSMKTHWDVVEQCAVRLKLEDAPRD